MNEGIKIVDLAAELERQVTDRKDLIAKANALTMTIDDPQNGSIPTPTMHVGGGNALGMTDHAHDQTAQYVDVPNAYYSRMRETKPALLAENVNTWLAAKPDTERRMVRTLDGKVRALLSERYRPMDNYDLASAILPIFKDRKVKVQSNGLDEKRMYIKGILPELSIGLDRLGLGERSEAYVAAIVVSNSEVGSGSLLIEAGYYITKCRNMASFSDAAMRKHHVGRSFGDFDGDFSEFFQDDTRAADDQALWLKVRDMVAGALDADVFKRRAELVAATRLDKIVSEDLPAVVEVTLRRYGLPDALSARVQSTIEDKYDLTRYGLSSALTDVSGRLKDYAVSTQLERAGGDIITLDPKDWKVIAEAVSPEKPKRAPRGRRAAVVS